MKFDIVIANPPYNDKDSTGKQGNKITMQRSPILPSFIGKFAEWTKTDGQCLFLSTPGVGQYIEKQGMFIHRMNFVSSKIWGKKGSINAVWWDVDWKKGDCFVHSKAINKIWKIKHYRRKANDPVIHYDKMTGNIGAAITYEAPAHHKASLQPTELNVKNFTTLMTFIAPFVRHIGLGYWLNAIRYLDYYWLDNVNHEITEQDIISYYNLDEEDLKELKKL